MRVLVTGSREWNDDQTLYDALNQTYQAWLQSPVRDSEFVVVHGGARGADALADQWTKDCALVSFGGCGPILCESHPADWDRYGRAAGHRRNQEMIDTKIDLVLAFPLGRSPGTRGCMKMAKKAGIPVRQFQPKLW